MRYPLPRPGDRLEIETHRGEESGHYQATVLDTTAEGLIIGLPQAGGETVAPKTQERLSIKYHFEGNGYEFETVVLAQQQRPYPLLYLFSPDPEKIIKRQLRQYVRVDTNLAVQISRQNDPTGEAFAGMIGNISAGGMKVSAMVDFKIGEPLRFRFHLPEEGADIDGIIGEVINVRPGAEGTRDFIVEFKGIPEATRDLIAKYVLDVQIKMRRRAKATPAKNPA